MQREIFNFSILIFPFFCLIRGPLTSVHCATTAAAWGRLIVTKLTIAVFWRLDVLGLVLVLKDLDLPNLLQLLPRLQLSQVLLDADVARLHDLTGHLESEL